MPKPLWSPIINFGTIFDEKMIMEAHLIAANNDKGG